MVEARRHGISRSVRAALVAVVGMLLVPAVASACSVQDRRDHERARAMLIDMRADNAPGYAAARSTYVDHRSGCRHGRYLRDATNLYRLHGEPVDGQVDWIRGVPYRAEHGRWHVDFSRIDNRMMRYTGRNRLRYVELIEGFALHYRGRAYWPSYPAHRRSLSSHDSLHLAAALARSGPQGRILSGATLSGYSARSVASGLVEESVLDTLSNAVYVNRIAGYLLRRGTPVEDRALARVGSQAVTQARAADQGAWFRFGGTDATLSEQRAATARLVRLRHLGRRDAVWVSQVRTYLTSKPEISFARIPVGVFYPWPADGAFDDQTVSLSANKPGAVEVRIYGNGSEVLATRSSDISLENIAVRWNGRAGTGTDQGAIAPAGEYRYVVTVTDLAGNRMALPGPGSFTIARDQIKPEITSRSVAYVSGRRRRFMRVAWSIREKHSPDVRVFLLVRGPSGRFSIPVERGELAGTQVVAKKLRPGRYKTWIRVLDGSGNRDQTRSGIVSFR